MKEEPTCRHFVWIVWNFARLGLFGVFESVRICEELPPGFQRALLAACDPAEDQIIILIPNSIKRRTGVFAVF